MVKIVRRRDESDDQFLKRFKKSVEKSGLITEVRDRAYYDANLERKKKNRDLRRQKYRK
jgi:ribosomal protein S21